MAEQSSTQEIQGKTIDIERKDGLLEELDLPPHVIKFIRQNSRNLQIIAVAVVVLILGWTYYDYYIQAKENNASAALSAAVSESDEATRLELLKKVESEYSGTGAALWSRIEQGHMASKQGNYEEALGIYNEVKNDLDSDSSLMPLLSYNIGLAFENNGEPDKALVSYQELAGYDGFSVKGLMAQGRIYELKGQNNKALDAYRQAAANEKVRGLDKNILTEKINTLKVSETSSE